MATFKLRENVLSGQTGLTVRLYALPGSSIVNGAGGDTLTETASSDGEFTATVAESLSGLHYYAVYKSGACIASGQVYCAGSTWTADDLLSVVTNKTNLLGTGDVTVSSPVSPSGTIASIVIGDDYKSLTGNAFEFTIDAQDGYAVATSTCTFASLKQHTSVAGWSVTGTMTDLGSNRWKLTFEMTKEVTSALSGTYDWSVELRSVAGDEKTVVTSSIPTKAIRKFT